MADDPVALADGTYEAFVVDAVVEGDGDERVTHLDLTIVAGDRKGEVLSVVATGMAGDEFELMGMPATLTVAAGTPTVVIDS